MAKITIDTDTEKVIITGSFPHPTPQAFLDEEIPKITNYQIVHNVVSYTKKLTAEPYENFNSNLTSSLPQSGD